MNKKTGEVIFDNNGEKLETNILMAIVNYSGKLIGQCDGLLLM